MKEFLCAISLAKRDLENFVNHPSSAFARFNTIITSLKALDDGYSSKNYVRKFLRVLHPKWRAKIDIKKDSEMTKLREKKKISCFTRSKKEYSDEECSTSESEDEKYAMAVKDLKKFFKRRDTNQRAFVGGSWSDSGEEDDEKVNNETSSSSGNKEIKFVKAQKKASSDGGPINMGGPKIVPAAPKIIMGPPPVGTPGSEKAHAVIKAKNNSPSTTRCLELLHMDLFGPSAVRSYGGNRYTLVIVDDYSRTDVHGREFDNEVQFGEFCNANGITRNFSAPRYLQNSKAYIIVNKHTRKVEESLNVTFDETPPPSKTSPLVDDDLDEEEAIKVTEKKNLEMTHDSTCQDMCDEFAKIMHDEFEMSMMGELNFFLGLQIKQMKDGIFFNQSKYTKEMLKKFGLEESKPMKTSMSSNTKLTKDEECESVDSTKYRGMIAVKRIFRYIKGTTHLGLWYLKGTDIETVVYADSDHAGDYVERKSTSGICTFMGCCLTSWFSKKQNSLAISTTEAEYLHRRRSRSRSIIREVDREKKKKPATNQTELFCSDDIYSGKCKESQHLLTITYYTTLTNSEVETYNHLP
ncbi:copia protein [Tanacetum coccineum]